MFGAVHNVDEDYRKLEACTLVSERNIVRVLGEADADVMVAITPYGKHL
jgi:hypothetical protein